jgi:hypothetical protein
MPSQHGLRPLREAVKGLGGRVIDKRTSLGKTLAKWRADLIDDLGGADSISTQQSALIDLCVKSKLILDSIDARLLTQPSLINKQKKTLLPAVRERQALADGLARYLKVKTLSDILSEDDEHEPAHTNGRPQLSLIHDPTNE